MAAADVVAGNENLHQHDDTLHNEAFQTSKDIDELNDKVSDTPKYSLEDASVHLVFSGTNTKKTMMPSFEVNLLPEKIVEVFRLPDGSQSFRVRWKDTWVHEQFIGAYQGLLNEFWDRQKEELIEGEHTDKEMDFEDMNGEVSSDNDSYTATMDALPDNDSYATTMDELLLEEEGKGKHDVSESFIEKTTPCDNNFTFIQEPGNEEVTQQHQRDVSAGLLKPSTDDVTGDVLMRSCKEESFQEHNNNEACSHSTTAEVPQLPIQSQPTTTVESILQGNNGEVLTDPDINRVIGELSGTVSLPEMHHHHETSLEAVYRKQRKTSASLKRLGKRVKKKFRKSDEKKVVKKMKLQQQHIEDEEKENNEDEYNDVMTAQQTNMDDDGVDAAEASGMDQLNDKRAKREKFNYPDDKGPCKCDICGKIISNKYGLREHQTVVHFKNGKFECKICGKRVTNKRALNLHMTSHSNERKFVCEMCGSSHKTKGNLNYHRKTMHTMIKNFRCDICFKTFKVQAELKEHCFSVHANEGVITCIVCKKKLTTALSIYTHSVMHSGAREHECDICGYAFKTLTGLKEHKITHSQDKPVRQCPYCERKFYSRSQYNAHVMRHTADGSLITYKCPICDVKFQHKSSYNRHVIRHQPGGDLEFPKENPYLLLDESELPDGVCHKCRKHYSSKSGFYLHLKKCRDGIVQQFKCSYCERGCSNRSSLKRHIQRRHKAVDFECQAMREHDIITKQEVDGVDVTSQHGVLTSQNGMQYHGTYFDHGYGNQITTVDASQLSAVDVQLLLDTAAAQNENQAATHILTNVQQVAQLTQNADAAQNLHILTENEAAQFAAQLTQHGVIVRSTDVTRGDQGPGDQHLIVGTTQIDGRTSQLLVSERQAAQLLANAQLDDNSTLTLQTSDRSDILRDANVLQFNHRTAVIQIQHNDGITTQQVLTLPEQQLHDDTDSHVALHVGTHLEAQGVQDMATHLEAQGVQDMDNENVRVTELQRSSDIKMECENSEVQQYDSSEVQQFDNTEVQQFDNTEVQQFDNNEVQQYENSEVQQFDNTEVQQFDNTEVQQFDNTEVQQFDNSEVQQYENNEVQQYDNSEVQQYDNNEVQQYIEEEQIVSSLPENDVEHAYQSITM